MTAMNKTHHCQGSRGSSASVLVLVPQVVLKNWLKKMQTSQQWLPANLDVDNNVI